MINVTQDQLADKPKKIGKVGETPVYHAVTKGGFHMVMMMRKGSLLTLGTGSHKALSRHVAEQVEPKLEWTELTKADYVDPRHFQHLVPKYLELTRRMRGLREE